MTNPTFTHNSYPSSLHMVKRGIYGTTCCFFETN